MERPLLYLNDDTTKQLQSLTVKSHESHMELNTILDWAAGADRKRAPKREDHCGIYGTAHWDRLTPEQRIELMWHENAQVASQFIWLEEALTPLFIRLLHKNHGRIPEDIREYMMVFCKEEIVHTQMFRRYLQVADLPFYGAPEIQYFLEQLVDMHPAVGVMCVFLGEAVAEEGAVRQDGPGIDPLSKQLFLEHHREEARHLAFGRWISESFCATCPPEAKAKVGALVRGLMSSLVPEFTFSPEVAEHLSFDLGIDPDDTEEIQRIRLSPNNRRINEERWGGLMAWLKRLGLAHDSYDWFDPVPARPTRFAGAAAGA